jgi:hypothetical protein
MPVDLPGPHHCIGTARAVTDVVFRSLHTQCLARGGTLSLKELELFHSKIIDSLSSGFNLFEVRHHQCMNASLAISDMPYARDKILATLLRECAEKSACDAFWLQIERSGMKLIGGLFDSLALYVHDHGDATIEGRLIKAYVETAATPHVKLTIKELLKHDGVSDTLLDCATAFGAHSARESIATEICDSINKLAAGSGGIDGSHVHRVTEAPMRSFLTLLPGQIRAAINAMPVVAVN